MCVWMCWCVCGPKRKPLSYFSLLFIARSSSHCLSEFIMSPRAKERGQQRDDTIGEAHMDRWEAVIRNITH